MPTHEQKINRIIKQLKERKSTKPVSLKKKAVSHEVPKPHDKRYSDEKIDISDLNEITHIDPEKRICIAEPGVTFVDLVTATIKYRLVPIIVPELKTITIGGAVAGCSIESMSYKYGGFHDTCLEYEVITAKGEVLICTPDNENSLLFQMVHGTFGTLGIISKLKFRLIPAKPFVKVTYEKYNNLEDYKSAIWRHFKNKDVDFMYGIIHAPIEYGLRAVWRAQPFNCCNCAAANKHVRISVALLNAQFNCNVRVVFHHCVSPCVYCIISRYGKRGKRPRVIVPLSRPVFQRHHGISQAQPQHTSAQSQSPGIGGRDSRRRLGWTRCLETHPSQTTPYGCQWPVLPMQLASVLDV